MWQELTFISFPLELPFKSKDKTLLFTGTIYHIFRVMVHVLVCFFSNQLHVFE